MEANERMGCFCAWKPITNIEIILHTSLVVEEVKQHIQYRGARHYYARSLINFIY